MQYTNIRYSITLNDAQLDYLSDEGQDISRMKCFKAFLQKAVLEETEVSGKGFTAVLQPGQFVASKVDLARLWECNRKTALRIIKEFNHMGILRSKASNRTTVHTLLCLSIWFTTQGRIKCEYYRSNPQERRSVSHLKRKRGQLPETEQQGRSSRDTGRPFHRVNPGWSSGYSPIGFRADWMIQSHLPFPFISQHRRPS